MINKNTHNTNLSWNPNWVNHQYFLLLQNYILQIVFSYYYRQRWYYTLFTSNYWKEAMTLGFINFYWNDAATPYLPSTTRRRLRPPCRHVACPSASQPPLYDNLISYLSTSIDLPIKCTKKLIKGLNHCLYTLKHISSSNSHVSSSWLFTNKKLIWNYLYVCHF